MKTKFSILIVGMIIIGITISLVGMTFASQTISEPQQKIRKIVEKNSSEFGIDIQNLSRIEGLIAFSKSETINGQRIPAIQILEFDEKDNTYKKIKDPRREKFLKEENKLFFPTYIQTQTDYANNHDITTEEVLLLMELARQR